MTEEQIRQAAQMYRAVIAQVQPNLQRRAKLVQKYALLNAHLRKNLRLTTR